MYLFSRNAKAAPGKGLEAMAAAVEIGKKASAVSGLDIQTWNHRFGHPVGSISWTCRVDSHADFLAATEKMYADAGYVEMEQAISDLIVEGEGDAFLRDGRRRSVGHAGQVLHDDPGRRSAGGKLAEAMEFRVGDHGLHPHVRRPIGRVLLLRLRWLLRRRVADRTRLDRSRSTRCGRGRASDAEYLKRVDAAADLFVVDSGHNGLVERVD